jgi:hypothetical protein
MFGLPANQRRISHALFLTKRGSKRPGSHTIRGEIAPLRDAESRKGEIAAGRLLDAKKHSDWDCCQNPV